MRLRTRLSLLLLLVGLGFSCQPGDTSFTSEGVVVTAPTDAERLQQALDKVGIAEASLEGAEGLKKFEGSVLVDRPDKVKGLPKDMKVEPLAFSGEIWDALSGTSDAEAAELLRERGIKTILLSSRAGPSLDRGRTVLSRLYNHDHLTHFSLIRLGDGLLYYRVLEKPVGFDPQLAGAAMIYLRQRLKGNPPGPFPNVKSETGNWTLVATIRGQGQEMSVALAQHDVIQGALEELVEDLEADHRRNIELIGFPPLAQHIDDLKIEIIRVVDRAYIEPREEAVLQDFWEPGIDGFYMMTADAKERGVLPGSASYTRGIIDIDRFLRHAAEQGRMSEKRPWRDGAAWLQLIRGHHFMEAEGGGLVYLFRGVPAIPLEAATMEAARQGVIHAGDWYLRNMAPSGQIVYKFWPEDNRYSADYNHVRHALGTWNLVQSWQLDKTRTDFLEGARRALMFTELYLKREPVPGGNGEIMAFYSFNNNQKLGSVVINLLGMIALAEATGDHQWDEQMKEMGRFTQFMQEPDGSFRGYYVEKDHPYYGQKNDIVPGEAALALVHLANYFDDDAWLKGLDRYWAYYQPWYEERASRGNWDRPWPAHTYNNDDRLELVQFGPWTVMAADAYYRRTKDEKVADFGLKIARWMIEAYEWTEETAPWPDYVGGYYKLPHELPAMQAFCYAEGTAAAYKLALAAGRTEEAAFFEKHTRETVRFALQMQFEPLQTYAFTRPAQVEGGIRYAMNEPKVRIDYVHHALSAMYQWHQGASEDPGLAEPVRTGPMLAQQKRRLEQEAAKREAARTAETALTYDPVVAYTGTSWPVPMANVAKLAPDQKSPGQ